MVKQVTSINAAMMLLGLWANGRYQACLYAVSPWWWALVCLHCSVSCAASQAFKRPDSDITAKKLAQSLLSKILASFVAKLTALAQVREEGRGARSDLSVGEIGGHMHCCGGRAAMLCVLHLAQRC